MTAGRSAAELASSGHPKPYSLAVYLVLGGLLLASFWPTIGELWAYWWVHPQYSHGPILPILAAWLLLDRRGSARQLEPTPSVLGLLLLLMSLALLLAGELKLSWFLKPYAMVGSVAGVVWALFGVPAIRVAFPSFVTLALMCPLPGSIQNALTLPLKNSAALLATGLLDLTGITATLEGNFIHLPGADGLWVADACSGINSLISLVTLATLASFLWKGPVWIKVVVVVSAIPIAILVNGLRIWLTGVLYVRVGPETAEGFFHFFEGFALFGVGALMLTCWAVLLMRIHEGWRS